ncbi:hypothetical protein V3C99_000967 [Haemonchus contortus]
MLRELYDHDFTIQQGNHHQREECRSREYHASFGIRRHGREGRRPLPSSPRFADDIMLITSNIEQEAMFMRNGLVPDTPFTLNGTNISERSSYVYLSREVNMMDDLAPKLCRRKRAAWGAFKSIEGLVKKTTSGSALTFSTLLSFLL